jgi:putative ABC transport system ATP-binding protein
MTSPNPQPEGEQLMATTTYAERPTEPDLRYPYAVAAVDVTRRYGIEESAVDALRGVSLDVPSGQFIAVMGPSGSGKSTLMHILAGLDSPTSGSVVVGGREITDLDDKQLTLLRRSEIGFVFQFFNLLPMLSAEENIVLPLQLGRRRVERAWVDELLARVGLADRRDHRPAQLSGGQQQRVAIARALVTDPTVLLADEPTGNLDSRSGQEILALLREAVDCSGQTTVMVTHDPRAAATADRVVFLSDGLVVEDLADPTEAAILSTIAEVVR